MNHLLQTLQTIAFSAYLREHHNFKPFLIVCPLSVLHNWLDEYTKFAPTVITTLLVPFQHSQCPQIPICMYHGTPAERAELRRTVMASPKDRKSSKSSKARGRTQGKAKSKPKTKSRSKPKAPPRKGTRQSGRFRKAVAHDEDDSDEVADKEEGDTSEAEGTPIDLTNGDEHDAENIAAQFPVVVTTYEMIIKDRIHLANYDWGYIVVDEGHRLKNLDCKLMKEIKKYTSAGRMILTGTPLHVSLFL